MNKRWAHTGTSRQPDVEADIVKAFIVRARRRRYLDGLANPKHRYKILLRLNSGGDFDARCVRLFPAGADTKARIEESLLQRGAPSNCYLISVIEDLDGRELSLTEALDHVVGSGAGTIISCIPGRLGYFEPEDGYRCILERTPD